MRFFVAAILGCSACAAPSSRPDAGPGEPVPGDAGGGSAWPDDAGAPVGSTLCVSGFFSWGADDGGTRAFEIGKLGPFHEVRMDFTWARIERTPGVYDFSELDPAVLALQGSGERVLGILDYDNSLYDAPDGGPSGFAGDGYAVTNVPAYAAFAAAAAAHFGPSVDYELWNEPNNAFSFWKAPPGRASFPDPAAYAALVASAAPAVHAACPRCRVLAGSIDYQGQELGAPFLAGMLAAAPRVYDLFDALSYHAYPDYPPSVPPDFSGQSGYSTPGQPEVPLVEMVARLRAEIQSSGGPTSFPVALTEVGWTTALLPDGSRVVTREEQASYDVRAMLLSFSTGGLVSCLYTLQDGANPADTEANFGVYAVDWSPKPAFTALVAMETALGDAAFERDRGTELGLVAGEHALSFLAADRRVTALYSDAPPRTVMVPAHAAVRRTQIVSLAGAVEEVTPQDGGSPVTLGPDPRFLVELR